MSRQEHRDRRLPFGADQCFYVRSRKHIGPGVAMGTLVRGRRFRTTPRRALCSRHKKGRSRGGSAPFECVVATGYCERSRGSSTSRRASPNRLKPNRSEEHTSELQSLMRISYAVFCLKKKTKNNKKINTP